MKNKKDLAKEIIKNLGIDFVIQCLIEIMDQQIDAPDYDIDSIKNPNDIWKFKVIEGLEHAHESFIYQQKLEESI